MRHSLVIEGPAYRLRPVRMYDAEFILVLRNDPQRGRYLHRGAADAAGQENWLREYFERPGDYYFVIENRATGLREGTVGIYGVDDLERHAEWGRWVLRRGSLAALESACLVYRTGFERLGLDVMYCRTIEENGAALAFHDSFGVDRVRRIEGYFEREGTQLDAIEGQLTRARWSELRENLERKAARAAGWSRAEAPVPARQAAGL